MNKVVIEAGSLPASVFFISDTHVGNFGSDYNSIEKAVDMIKRMTNLCRV